jgi:hypothetical protein
MNGDTLVAALFMFVAALMLFSCGVTCGALSWAVLP